MPVGSTLFLCQLLDLCHLEVDRVDGVLVLVGVVLELAEHVFAFMNSRDLSVCKCKTGKFSARK